MNLFRSICCLFAGRCAGEGPKPTKETMRGEVPVSEGDLGLQKPHWRRQAKSGWVIWRAANQSEDDMRLNHRLSLASLVVVALLTIASVKAADAAVRCQGNFQITNSSQARR